MRKFGSDRTRTQRNKNLQKTVNQKPRVTTRKMKKHSEENAMKPMSILIVAAVFAVFGLASAPSSLGVVPAPDGGYPGGNTAEGENALLGLTSGLYNTGTGLF